MSGNHDKPSVISRVLSSIISPAKKAYRVLADKMGTRAGQPVQEMPRNHHGPGVISRLIAPLRKLYRKYYIPLLHLLANKMGGRARAGRLGRASRILRLIGNTITLGTIIAAIAVMGFTTFWTGGAALPIWAAVLIAVGVGINTIGLVIGTPANHQKIQQYMDLEGALHERTNELENKRTPLPHGMDASFAKKAAAGARYVHDGNGLSGSAASFASQGLEFAATVAGVVVDPIVFSVLFVASRASALISATGAPLTNLHRLWAYKGAIEEGVQKYYAIREKNNLEKHKYIQEIIDKFFTMEKIQPHFVTSIVRLMSYMAIDAAMVGIMQNDENKQQLSAALSTALKPFIVNNHFDREKLMIINGKNNQLCVPDSMYLIEHEVFNKCAQKTNPNRYINIFSVVFEFSRKYLYEDGLTSALFRCHLVKLLMLSNIDDTQIRPNHIYRVFINDYSDYLIEVETGKYILNKEKIYDLCPPLDNPHGQEFNAPYHTQHFSMKIIEKIARNLEWKLNAPLPRQNSQASMQPAWSF